VKRVRGMRLIMPNGVIGGGQEDLPRPKKVRDEDVGDGPGDAMKR